MRTSATARYRVRRTHLAGEVCLWCLRAILGRGVCITRATLTTHAHPECVDGALRLLGAWAGAHDGAPRVLAGWAPDGARLERRHQGPGTC
jgi:hypothetical protein